MTTNNIKSILCNLAKGLSLPVYKDVHPPVTREANFERIVVNVISKDNSPWSKGFANVNIFIPFLKGLSYDAPDTVRLDAVEASAESIFRSNYTNGLLVEIDTIRTEADPETFSYFVNVRLKIQTNNNKL